MTAAPWLRLAAAGSSLRVSVRPLRVAPDASAERSTCRYDSRADWSATVDAGLAATGKSPVGTSGAGMVTGAPSGGGSGSGWVAENHDPVTVAWSAPAGSGATAPAA